MKIPKPKKLPSGMYRIQLQIGGERISITRSSDKDCINEAKLIKAQYANDIRPKVSKSNLTLGAAIDEYIRVRENVLSPSTVRGYKEIGKNRFKAYHDRKIKSVNWQQAVNDEFKLCSAKTLKNAWGFVHSVLKENGIDASVRTPALPVHEKQWLTPEQIPVFMEAIKGKSCEIPALLALSSLRKSELLGLEWSNVNLKKDIIHVRGAAVRGPDETFVRRKQNKTSASTRDVPIIPQLHDALSAVEDKTGPVITCHYQTPYKQIAKICEQLGYPNVGLHGLRHSFASLCYHLGMSELETMQLGGWSDYQTMRKIYTHLSAEDRAKSSEKLTNFFKNSHENAHDT